MTVRKIIELIDFIKSAIGKSGFSSSLQDCIVTIDNNSGNIVLLKDITDKVNKDYQMLLDIEIPDLLLKVLVDKVKPFTEGKFYADLLELKETNYSEPSELFNKLHEILVSLQARIEENIIELDKIAATIRPFLSKDYSEIQNNENAIFSIIFENEVTYNNLKLLSYELKNWDRGLHIYQQIVSDETPKPFEIIEIDQGSIEVVINLDFHVAGQLLELFKTALEVYVAYLSYKTLIQEKLFNSFKGNPALLKGQADTEKLLLENIKIAVKSELKAQAKKAKKKHEALDKKIDQVANLITEHVIKGNSVKLLSAPESKEEIFQKEEEKQGFYVISKNDYKKLDEATKQLLIAQYITVPPIDNYEIE